MDNELAHTLAAIHYNMNYADVICIYCGKPMPRYGEGNEQNAPIRSQTDMTKVVPVHASCYYEHEADETWRKNNPEAMPIDEGGSRL